jgi:hypothetical protein
MVEWAFVSRIPTRTPFGYEHRSDTNTVRVPTHNVFVFVLPGVHVDARAREPPITTIAPGSTFA